MKFFSSHSLLLLLCAIPVFLVACRSWGNASSSSAGEGIGEGKSPSSVYDFTVKDAAGKDVSLKKYQGKVLLIVNTASKCGFTPQYAGLETLYQTYKDKGLVVLGFPCNQFGRQEPGKNAEIQTFCQVNYGVTFPVMAKVDVNGSDAIPLYKYLKGEEKGLLGTQAIKWNFTKFLVDKNGQVVDRYASKTKPAKLADDIEKLLSATGK